MPYNTPITTSTQCITTDSTVTTTATHYSPRTITMQDLDGTVYVRHDNAWIPIGSCVEAKKSEDKPKPVSREKLFEFLEIEMGDADERADNAEA